MTKKQITITVNGTSYDVEVGSLAENPIQVVVNGKPYEVNLAQSSVPIGTSSAKPAVTAVQMPAQPATPRPAAAAQSVVKAGAENELRAPMPGTILNIAVKVGDRVSRGQQVCALEAMKMKSAIRPVRDGVIAGIEVVDGQKVAFNDLLFRFE